VLWLDQDLRALLTAITDDLQATGQGAELADGPELRALANLVGNALRYGGSARLGLPTVSTPTSSG